MDGETVKYSPKLIFDGIRFVPSLRFNKGYTRLHYLHIDITTRCNLKCKMCEWRYKVNQVNPIEMSFEDFRKLIGEGMRLGARKIVLSATGEGTLHKNFPEMIDYAYNKGLEIEMITNLTVLNEKILGAVLRVNSLTVSFDGATKKTYERIRVGASFDRTVANLKTVVSRKGKMKISVNHVLQKDNIREVDKFVELICSIGGIDYVSFKLPHNEVSEVWKKVMISDKDLDWFIAKLDEIYAKFRRNGIKVDINADPKNHRDEIRKGIYRPWIHEIPCYNLWTGAFVNPEGFVLPCCNFYRKSDALGNVNEQPLAEIWRSAKYNKLRKRFRGTKPKVCEGCPGDLREFHKLLTKVPMHKVLFGV